MKRQTTEIEVFEAEQFLERDFNIPAKRTQYRLRLNAASGRLYSLIRVSMPAVIKAWPPRPPTAQPAPFFSNAEASVIAIAHAAINRNTPAPIGISLRFMCDMLGLART